MSALNFVSFFIEDLLTGNMLKNGVFNLEEKPFSPTAAIQFVIDLFKPQIMHRNIRLNFNVANSLDKMPLLEFKKASSSLMSGSLLQIKTTAE